MKYCPKCQRSYSGGQALCPQDGERLSFKDIYGLSGLVVAGKYQIGPLIGVGGTSAVYLARQTEVERQVAFKVLLPHLAGSNEKIGTLYEREAKAAGRLSHENIATVYDAGRTEDGMAYIVIEYLTGQTLEELIARSAPLNPEHVLYLLRQIAAALEAAHAQNIIHRDLKPSNIMLVPRPDGTEQVKVLDFGLAKLSGGASDLQVSTAVGTPNYASPEQFHLGAEISVRSDLYALGAMLYQMLTGQLPYKAETIHEMIKLHLLGQPTPLHRLRPDLPQGLEALIHRMLAKSPHYRPASASEVVDCFARALAAKNKASETGAAGPVSPASFQVKSQRSSPRPSERTESLPPNFQVKAKHTGSLNTGRLTNPTPDFQVRSKRTDNPPPPTTLNSLLSPIKPPSLAPAPERQTFWPSESERRNPPPLPPPPPAPSFGETLAQHKGIAALLLAGLIGLIATFILINYTQTPKILHPQEVVLIADFANNTGDATLETQLKQTLNKQLMQNAQIVPLSDDEVQKTLRALNRKTNERLTRDLARDLARRQQIKALLIGELEKINQQYALTLSAISSETGVVFAQTQVNASDPAQLLTRFQRLLEEWCVQLIQPLGQLPLPEPPAETTPPTRAKTGRPNDPPKR